jgi:NAD(P)-dependent dehydrogenase (short-subunit alcohol dehydrogenase family)
MSGTPHRGAPTIFTHTASLSKGNTMSTVITGASGHLGRLVVDQLLAAGTSPAQIVATGRDAGKLRGPAGLVDNDLGDAVISEVVSMQPGRKLTAPKPATRARRSRAKVNA